MSNQTKNCKYCQSEISKKAKICPVCKKKQKHTFLGIVLLVIGLIGISASCSSMLSETDTAQTNQTTVSNSATTTDEGYATLDKFNQIETGMTYEQVVEIMGSEGTIMSESDVMEIKTAMYYWYSENGVSNMNITIQNNAVVAKAQFGLE